MLKKEEEENNNNKKGVRFEFARLPRFWRGRFAARVRRGFFAVRRGRLAVCSPCCGVHSSWGSETTDLRHPKAASS